LKAVFFYTVTLSDRSSDALVRHIDRLRRICLSVQRRRPFETVAIFKAAPRVALLLRLAEAEGVDAPLVAGSEAAPLREYGSAGSTAGAESDNELGAAVA
jgi:hypothetical protein